MTARLQVTVGPGDAALPGLARDLVRLAWPAAIGLVLLTAAWVATLVLAPQQPAGADAAARLRFIAAHDGWQVASFAVVVPLALLHVPVWFGLAALAWPARPAAGLLAAAYGLLYAPFTCLAYWTQLTVVRGLAEVQASDPAAAVAAHRLFAFGGSLASLSYSLAVLGYAIWGLASLAAARGLLARRDRLARATAALLGLAGGLALAGAAGYVARNGVLESGVLLSGVAFLPAMIAATFLLRRASRDIIDRTI
jgi:hypothetical protein